MLVSQDKHQHFITTVCSAQGRSAFNFSCPLLCTTWMQKQACNEALILHPHDAAQALPLEHQVERRVDLREGHAVCDELLQLQLLRHRRLLISQQEYV